MRAKKLALSCSQDPTTISETTNHEFFYKYSNQLVGQESSIFQTFWKANSCTDYLFVFRVRDFKFWLLAYFFISFNYAEIQQDGRALIDIL